MKKILLSIILALVSIINAKSGDFEQIFCDSTLRIDIKTTSKGHDFSVCIDSMSQWPGWYGRRVNLSKEQHPEMMQVAVIDCASGDTVYVDSKSPEAFGEEGMQSELYTTVFVPKPRHDSEIKVTFYWPDERRRREIQSVSRHLYSHQLAHMVDGRDTPRHPYREIRKAADPEQCIHLAIVAEGYTPDQMDLFIADAQALDAALFKQPGFKDRAEAFQVVAVMLPSAEQGITIPSQGVNINSALKSHFDSYGLERLVTVPDTRQIWDALECVPASQVLILANTEKYGGSGSYNEYAIASARQPDFEHILIHEFGHSFGWLGDEYEVGDYMSYPPDIEPLEPNITTLHRFTGKWEDLIESGEASLYEGAGYQEQGVWRGCEHCLMRAIEDQDFCIVCARIIQKAIDYFTIAQ